MQRCTLATMLFLATSLLPAQAPNLVLPQPSPRASASQTVGLTEINVTYSRPSVHGRKIWGELVPYGQVWRAGANENTVVTFSTPVSVGGVALPAGSYGLHMLPTEKEWKVMFSRQAHAWGSFSYDPKEDAARVTVTPVPGEPTDRLAFTYDDPSDDGVTLSLHWDKLKVPVRLDVDTKPVVLASLRDQLRGLPRFSAEGWSGAARWCAQNGVNTEEALTWVNRSLEMKETFGALRVKALLLEKGGDAKGAEALRAKAMTMATEVDINNLGYALLAQGKVDEAIGLFHKNVASHPDSWNVYDSLGEAYGVKGDRPKAVLNYQKALGMVRQEDQRVRIKEAIARYQ
jgi:hypothetical protein